MKRNLGTKKIFSRRIREEEPNPMEGVANLVDVMLVLAVGIMLALIINWNVDIKKDQQADQSPIINPNDGFIEQQEQGEPIGVVYERADGTLYYVVNTPQP